MNDYTVQMLDCTKKKTGNSPVFRVKGKFYVKNCSTLTLLRVSQMSRSLQESIMSENNEHELQQWAEQFYAKLVEERQAVEAPSMMDQLLEKAGNWVDQKIEELPPEEQEAAEMKLMATADALVDTLDKAYTVTEKACDSIIDSLDELEKWIDKW